MKISPSVARHVACRLIHLNLLAMVTTELFLVGILFFFVYTTSNLYFVFDIMYEDLLYGYYSLPFKLSVKVLPVTLTLLFFSFILYIPTKLFWVAQTKNHLNVRSPRGENAVNWKHLKYCWCIFFITLLINKATDSDDQHFLFNTSKKENKEDFLTGSSFCTWANWKKYITEATVPECSIESSFKQVWVILQVYPITAGWNKLKPWTNYPKKKWYTMETSSFPQL